MLPHTEYGNFVRPSSNGTTKVFNTTSILDGEEAKKLYLEEVGDIESSKQVIKCNNINKKINTKHKQKTVLDETEHRQIFFTVQNNDIEKLCKVLDCWPEKLNAVDEYGWSLLMIACQASSVEIVKELLKRGADTSIRDKAGNSAQSLIIKNKNGLLAKILMEHMEQDKQVRTFSETTTNNKQKSKRLRVNFTCEICNKVYDDKEEHLSSTIHNINASKGKKIPANYVIPESNKGFQLMLRYGWNKEDGLGPDGSGKKYPLKTKQKNDKMGLGHKKKQTVELKVESHKEKYKYKLKKDQYNDRQKEINFRREFY